MITTRRARGLAVALGRHGMLWLASAFFMVPFLWTVSLSLKANAAEGPSGTPSQQQQKISPILKWVIVGGIVVGALIVADNLTKEETPASGF